MWQVAVPRKHPQLQGPSMNIKVFNFKGWNLGFAHLLLTSNHGNTVRSTASLAHLILFLKYKLLLQNDYIR